MKTAKNVFDKIFSEHLMGEGDIMCFTGRRPKDLVGYGHEQYKEFVDELCNLLHDEFYVKRHVRKYVTGGAQGFDQLAFWAVNRMARKYELTDVKNIVFVPYKDQYETGNGRSWRKEGAFGIDEYEMMLRMADGVYMVSDVKSIPALFQRNEAMVDVSDYCLGLYPDEGWRTAGKGGTSGCMKYAMSTITDLFPTKLFRLGYDLKGNKLNIGGLVEY